MVKRCCYGTCKSDTRYPDRLTDDLSFVPFPKPARNLEKGKRWIRLCGRLHEQLNLEILNIRQKAKHLYVCTKHFKDGKPTAENPDPQPACILDKFTPVRRPPKLRSLSEPPKKKARTALTEIFREDGNEVLVHPPVQFSESESVNTADQADHSTETLFSSHTDENICLDMLAMAAENESLKQQIAKLILENIDLTRRCTPKRDSENVPDTKTLFSAEKLRDNKKKDEFVTLFQFLVPVKKPFKMTKKKKQQKTTQNISSFEQVSMEDQLLIVLVKLRQNFDFSHLGKLFGISQQDASTLFTSWIQFMFYRCDSVSIWPHRDVIIAMMPDKFREEFPNTLMTRQSQCYSDYKSCNTLKGLVCIDPRGSIIFASMFFLGPSQIRN